MKKTLYQILGVDPKASAAEIVAAYNARVEELSVATLHDPNKLVVLQQAKEILSDPNRRAAYDASLTPAGAAPRRETAAEPEPGVMQVWGKWIAAGVILIAVSIWWTHRGAPPPAPRPTPPQVAPAPSEPSAQSARPANEPATPPAEAKDGAAPPAALPPAQEAPSSPVAGVWSCNDSISGRTSKYEFQPDGTLTISGSDGPAQSLNYEISGMVLKVGDPKQSSTLSIEVSTARKLVLNTGAEGRRLVCSR
jgi:hypothetical protein